MNRLLERARANRKNPTSAEKVMWSLLRNRRFQGLKFVRQHPIGAYEIDFVCRSKKLVIELDGDRHYRGEKADAARTKILQRMGYHVVRFWNEQVIAHPESVLRQLRWVLERKASWISRKS